MKGRLQLVGTCSLLVCGAISLAVPHSVRAQDLQATAVATSVRIDEGARDGDIIAFNDSTGTYRLAQGVGDIRIAGVVTMDPLLHFTVEDGAEGSVPLVRFGEAVVNVSDAGGHIRAGDLVTSSEQAGIGIRAPSDTDVYVLGVALEDMQSIEGEAGQVLYGRVPVALRIGPASAMTGMVMASTTPPAAVQQQPENQTTQRLDLIMLFRYLLAAIVAFGAMVAALRSFGGSLSQSIISVGRNPLAKSSITSMLIWNSILIVLVSSLGLAIGAAIILLPR